MPVPHGGAFHRSLEIRVFPVVELRAGFGKLTLKTAKVRSARVLFTFNGQRRFRDANGFAELDAGNEQRLFFARGIFARFVGGRIDVGLRLRSIVISCRRFVGRCLCLSLRGIGFDPAVTDFVLVIA